jgi:DNA-binding XRE family transcriptional regulator
MSPIGSEKMNTKKLKNKAFQNPEVKKEYDSLNLEFELIDALVTMRRKSGLTQDEVAQKMGTQKSNVSRLENGAGNPSWKTLQNYAYACGFQIGMKFKSIRGSSRS